MTKFNHEEAKRVGFFSMDIVAENLRKNSYDREYVLNQIELHLENYAQTEDWAARSLALAYMTAFGL